MSIRSQIITAVKTRMQGILTSGGYTSNLGQNITVNRTTPVAADETLPALDLRFEFSVSQTLYHTDHEIKVLATIVAVGDLIASDMAEKIADVVKAIGVDPKWSNLASATVQGDPDTETQTEAKTITTGRQPFSIYYRTGLYQT